MKGCPFPSVSLTPGLAGSPNSPEASSAQQHPLIQPAELSCRRQSVLDLGSCLRAADSC